MTNQIENLTALRDAVEAGETTSADGFPSGLAICGFTIAVCRDLIPAVRDKSTDAALQWLAAVVPGCRINIAGIGKYWGAEVSIGLDDHGKAEDLDNPATALILAGLNAKIAQLQETSK